MPANRVDNAQIYGVYFTSAKSSGWELDGQNQPRKFTKTLAERYAILENAKLSPGTGSFQARKLDSQT